MGQRPSEELELIAARIPATVARKLETMAEAEGRATSSLARVIIENFFYVGPPPQMRMALEEDEKRLGINRRDYINHLLFERIRVIEKQVPAKPRKCNARPNRDGFRSSRTCLRISMPAVVAAR